MQRSKGFGHEVVVSTNCIDLFQCSDCALSCAMWLLQTKEQWSILSFSFLKSKPPLLTRSLRSLRVAAHSTSDCALSCAMWLLQTNELSRLSFWQQWVGSRAASLSAAHVRKMRLTAQKRFVGHVCLRNPFLPFLWEMPSIHSLSEAWGSWERQYTLPALHYGCILPIPSLQL